MRKSIKILLATVAVVLLVSGFALATPILQISDGTDTVTITDGQTGDINSASGVVSWIGSIGNFSINATTGATKPALGSSDQPIMDLSSINISGGSGSLTIMWTEKDFTLPDQIPGFVSAIGGVTSGQISLRTYLDENNAAFGLTTLLSDLGTFSGGAFSGHDAAFLNPTEPFSLTIVADITHKQYGATSFNASVSPVPEPATVFLLGVGLLVVGLAGRKRCKAES